MPLPLPPPRELPVWDCHICGAPDAFTGHPERCASVPSEDGTVTHGLYHDDGTLCRWEESPDGTRRPLAVQFRWTTAP